MDYRTGHQQAGLSAVSDVYRREINYEAIYYADNLASPRFGKWSCCLLR